MKKWIVAILVAFSFSLLPVVRGGDTPAAPVPQGNLSQQGPDSSSNAPGKKHHKRKHHRKDKKHKADKGKNTPAAPTT